MPEEGLPPIPEAARMTTDEVIRLVTLAHHDRQIGGACADDEDGSLAARDVAFRTSKTGAWPPQRSVNQRVAAAHKPPRLGAGR